MSNFVPSHAGKEMGSSAALFKGLLLYLFIYYVQPGARITALSPLRLEFAVGALLLFLIVFKIINNKIEIEQNKIHLWTVIFFAMCAINIPFAFVKTNALNVYIQYLKFFAIYIMVVSIIDDEKKLSVYFYLYLGLIALLFVEPFFLSLKGEGFIYNNHMMRLRGVTPFFGHPNQLGGITSANLPFFYYMMLHHKSKPAKLTFFVLIIIAIRVIMLTQSRTAFLGVFAFAGFVWLTSRNKLKSLIIMMILSVVAWQFAPDKTKDRFRTLAKSAEVLFADSEGTFQGDRDLGSMNSRTILMKRSLIVFIENPIIGVGMGCFQSVSGRRWGSWFPPHCLYTQALSEIGLMGTIPFIVVIFLVFKNISETKALLQNKDNMPFNYYLALSLYGVLLVRLVVGTFGQDLYRNWWWEVAALSIVNLNIVRKNLLHLEDAKPPKDA